jgi:hypothetical protein
MAAHAVGYRKKALLAVQNLRFRSHEHSILIVLPSSYVTINAMLDRIGN